ncbi:MAG: DISARM system SNF2-like helicase DrmD [Kofleriaceae bacterium]
MSALPKGRLVELGRELAVAVPSSATKEQQIERLAKTAGLDLATVIRLLSRDELRLACKAHGLDDSGRSRLALATRLLGHTPAPGALPAPLFSGGARATSDLPEPGDIVRVRHRQYLVEDVIARPLLGEATRVRLVCLDDDNQGRPLDVLWELELGARVLQPETHGLGEVKALDPPTHFAAYLHALRWHAVTATDARLFQAPFRAGIELMNHQLTPLKKALALPRANLFIADDVGLGKTIEAGLVLQELLLRQQVELVLIVAPASVCLQWKGEMQARFGLHFEIYNRVFMARRRQERGFGVNPWTTHSRFIISYQTLRRPEYRDPLLARLGERARKSLLILDEAHTAAPASASKYAVDSRITKVIRDLSPRFDNRLMLSATPHNGHSNSFSALLELLDPQRFTRGVRPSGQALDAVMVRRLKEDLRQLGVESFPRRSLVQLDVGAPDCAEVQLSELLAEYTRLMKPERGRGRLVFVNLQKRLLSSVEAFRRTLEVHAESLAAGRARTALQLSLGEPADDDEGAGDDEYGADDDTLEAASAAQVDAASRLLQSPEGRARELLSTMRALAAQHATGPDAKVTALLDWIRAHQCPGVRLGGAAGKGAQLRWSDRRVLLFTEYGDTKRYLLQLLGAALDGTHLADERILQLHGGMSEDQREEVQRAFNGPPDEHPVRILLATDAAREGVNLQGACADLFHMDVPWNPARMEQRNGRIDRTLQPAPEVRCHYFFYPHRAEDLVLQKLVAKVGTIQAELGSLGGVVMDRLAAALELGIDARTAADLDDAEAASEVRATVKEELESQREVKKLKADLDDNAKIAGGSRKLLDFEPALLRNVVDIGLAMAGAPPLAPVDPADPADEERFALPALGDSWQGTLDSLRRARRRDESFWEWRDDAPPRPVVFRPPPRLSAEVCHLHLSHPFVQRILSRFRAQGFSAQDLARVTALRNPHEDEVVVVAFGRLSLFGPGASRLHDQLIPIAARWRESGGKGHRAPLEGKDHATALDTLNRLLRELSADARPLAKQVCATLAAEAPGDFAALWPEIQSEAESVAHQASAKLEARARAEAAALTKLLEEQRAAITRELARRRQLDLSFSEAERDQREQYQADEAHMAQRLAAIDRELETEPAQIRSLYQVALQRLEPVGLVYLWPETR